MTKLFLVINVSSEAIASNLIQDLIDEGALDEDEDRAFIGEMLIDWKKPSELARPLEDRTRRDPPHYFMDAPVGPLLLDRGDGPALYEHEAQRKRRESGMYEELHDEDSDHNEPES